MSQEALNRTVRQSRRRRTLGANDTCTDCGTADPMMLVTPKANPAGKKPASKGPSTRKQSATATSSNSVSVRRAKATTLRQADAASAPEPSTLCYECLLVRDGKATSEEHHVFGKTNDATTTILAPGNQHRILSELQDYQPEDVRNNHYRDPLLELAGGCLSLKDHLVLWVERLCRVAEWLIELCFALREHFGTPQWWEPLGVPPLWGEAAA
jgi:hypothetical protein